VIAYRRRTPGTGGAPDQIALVVLSFSDASRSITLPAPAPGVYRELLDRLNRPRVSNSNEPRPASEARSP